MVLEHLTDAGELIRERCITAGQHQMQAGLRAQGLLDALDLRAAATTQIDPELARQFGLDRVMRQTELGGSLRVVGFAKDVIAFKQPEPERIGLSAHRARGFTDPPPPLGSTRVCADRFGVQRRHQDW